MKAYRLRFSPFRCFAYDAGLEDLACLRALRDFLMTQSAPLALYQGGRFFDYFLDNLPEIVPLVKYIIVDDPAGKGKIKDIPIISPREIPHNNYVIFLCETEAFPLQRMEKQVASLGTVITPRILPEIAGAAIPLRAWIPAYHTIYPLEIPEVEIFPDQDLVILNCPALEGDFLPIGLGYLANALKRAGVHYQILDLNILAYHRYHTHRLLDGPARIVAPNGSIMPPDPWRNDSVLIWQDQSRVQYFSPLLQETIRALIKAKPKILGLSVQECNITFCREIAQAVRQELPDTIILAGGYSCYYPEIGRSLFPDYDYMVIGEADLTVGPLVQRLLAGERPANLPGILSRDDSPSQEYVPGPRPEDLDALGSPDYDWTAWELYRHYNHYQCLPVIASRGCKWSRCKFCNERFPWRSRTPKNFVDELEWLLNKGGDLFMFYESDMNGDPEILEAICDEIIKRNLVVRLVGQLRINKRNTRDFFEKLRRAGFKALRFGVDGWSPHTLRLMNKGYTIRTIEENLRNSFAAGLPAEINVVIGVPGETEADVAETIEIIKANKPYIWRLGNVNPIMLLHGSVFWQEPEKYGIKFVGNKEELYRRFPLAIPADLWYSVDPLIDHHLRSERFLRLVRELREYGFEIGEMVEYIEHLASGQRYGGNYQLALFGHSQKEHLSEAESAGSPFSKPEDWDWGDTKIGQEPEGGISLVFQAQGESYGLPAGEVKRLAHLLYRNGPKEIWPVLAKGMIGKLAHPQLLYRYLEQGITLLKSFWRNRARESGKSDSLPDLLELMLENNWLRLKIDTSGTSFHVVAESFQGYKIFQLYRDFYGIRQGIPFDLEALEAGKSPPGTFFHGQTLAEVTGMIKNRVN
ncbi:MAG: radical SAM protein [Thermodesulfobacteriota bacterium]